MDPASVLARLRATLVPWPEGLHAEVDDLGDVNLYTRADMIHLDADALADRLHAWTLRELHATLPRASALLSFRHARPASPHDDAELDLQETWLHLEPTLRFEMSPPPLETEVDAFARLVPIFLRRIRETGRPAGFRRHDVGATE